MYIVAKIHNNSLGKVVRVDDEEAAKKTVIKWAEEQLQRPLFFSEMQDIEDELECFNDEDPENVYCFSIGVVEE